MALQLVSPRSINFESAFLGPFYVDHGRSIKFHVCTYCWHGMLTMYSIPSLFSTVSDMAFHRVWNGQGRELSDTPLARLVPLATGACRHAVRLNMTAHHIGDTIYGLHSEWPAWQCHRHHGPQLQARLASVVTLLHLFLLHASWHSIIIPLQNYYALATTSTPMH